MTKEELAEQLNGCEYGDEISPGQEKLAKENNLVVVFGYSDDGMELRGAIHDEIYPPDGKPVYLSRKGFFDSDACDCECKYFKEAKEAFKQSANPIIAKFDAKGYSWIYETNILHSTFDVLEDGEKYCRGMVFSIDDLIEP